MVKYLRMVPFASVLATFIVLVGCGGGKQEQVQSPRVTEPPASILAVQQAFEAEPVRGTVYYYCDCGTGAEADCVVGSDSNAGTSASAPRRTIADAMSRLNSLNSSSSSLNTIALCKGGAFDAQARLNIANSGCAVGNTCTDLREYTPTTFTGTARPILTTPENANLFYAEGTSAGGVRIMNLALRGASNIQSNDNRAIFLYDGAHDIKIYNNDISGFFRGISSQEGTNESVNNEVVGNNFSNMYSLAFLGGGSGTRVNYNAIRTTGGNAPLNHAIYMATGAIISYDVEVIGNDIQGQYGSSCLGAIISNHGAFDGYRISYNTINIFASETSAGCFGIANDNVTNDPDPVLYRHAVFSGNTIINAGNTSMTITSSPGVIIENNLIVNDWSGAVIGISVTGTNRGQDDTSNANVIRNNTIWYGPNVSGNTRGISVGANGGEGTGHIIANNSVSSTQGAGILNCFRHDLPLSAYAFVNNNHCHATGSFNFEFMRGTLAAWQAYAAGTGFDTDSIVEAPQFAATGSDYRAGYFKPVGGSPLSGAGTSLHMSTQDFAYVNRPTPPAMGAYEP